MKHLLLAPILIGGLFNDHSAFCGQGHHESGLTKHTLTPPVGHSYVATVSFSENLSFDDCNHFIRSYGDKNRSKEYSDFFVWFECDENGTPDQASLVAKIIFSSMDNKKNAQFLSQENANKRHELNFTLPEKTSDPQDCASNLPKLSGGLIDFSAEYKNYGHGGYDQFSDNPFEGNIPLSSSLRLIATCTNDGKTHLKLTDGAPGSKDPFQTTGYAAWIKGYSDQPNCETEAKRLKVGFSKATNNLDLDFYCFDNGPHEFILNMILYAPNRTGSENTVDTFSLMLSDQNACLAVRDEINNRAMPNGLLFTANMSGKVEGEQMSLSTEGCDKDSSVKINFNRSGNWMRDY